jgi:starch-binding outer membrane protein, SusD/RagB family
MKRINKITLISDKGKNLGFILALLTGFIFIVGSCQKDFLEITPKDSFTEAAVFNDPALLDAFVNFTYRMTPHGFQEHGGILALATMGDEAHSKGNVATAGQIIAGNQRPDFLHALDVWTGRGLALANRDRKSYWTPIKQANEFLHYVGDSEVDADLLERMTGEIKALRAYAYFRLISHYGGVPLATEPFSMDNWRMARNSYDEVMTFVLKELDEAIDMLPLSYTGRNVGKLTKGAAMAIKARALLYYASPLNNPSNDLSRWQAAADAAKAVIDMGIYELYPDYKAVFLEKTGWHSEIIWARPFHHITEAQVFLERRIFPNSWLGHGHTPPTHNLADAYEMTSGLLPSEDPAYNPQNPYVNRDPRFYATILHDGAPFKGRTIETFIGGLDSFESHISSWNASETGYNLGKFIDEDVDDIGSGNTNAPWIYIRYAEVLLNYAEAMYNLGQEDVARQYVNMVRSRPGVGMPDVTESGEALWQRIVHERRIELAYEEHRFFDVRRWKIATDVFSVTHTRIRITRNPATGVKTYEVLDHMPAKFNEHNYLSPIPLSEIERNGLLEQNPGY